MRRAVLAVVALVLVAAALVARHDGWLGGRADGGPLDTAAIGFGATVRPGERIEWKEIALRVPHGDPVTIQSVRVGPARMLRGLRVGAPRVEDHTAEGAEVGARSVRLTIPVTPLQTGPYELSDVRIRYRRGARHFERRAKATLRLDVRR